MPKLCYERLTLVLLRKIHASGMAYFIIYASEGLVLGAAAALSALAGAVSSIMLCYSLEGTRRSVLDVIAAFLELWRARSLLSGAGLGCCCEIDLRPFRGRSGGCAERAAWKSGADRGLRPRNLPQRVQL